MKKKIAIVFGGESIEHEVSLASAAELLTHIDKSKYYVYPIGITKYGEWFEYNGDVDKIASGQWENDEYYKVPSGEKILFSRDVDCVFPLLHGRNGEDGTIQGLCKLLKLPIVGSKVLASSLCMDKAYGKFILEKFNIPVTPYLVIEEKEFEDDKDKVLSKIINKFSFPLIVKPSSGGSSMGVSKVRVKENIEQAIQTAFKFDNKILIEKAINLREFKVPVLGKDSLFLGEIGEIDYHGKEIFDYEEKYLKEVDNLICPVDLSEDVKNKIYEYARRAFKVLDCSGMARVDFFIDKETGEIYINEVNTIPGFTKNSSYPKLLGKKGISEKDIIDKLIEYAINE